MRRWYAAFAVAIACLLIATVVPASGAVAAHSALGAPKVLSATATSAQPTVVAAPSPQPPTPAFGGYAVVGLETLIAAALLCYAYLQRRRSSAVPLLHWFVRLRGPPVSRDRILFAP